MTNPLDEVLTHEQQQLLAKAIEEASQGAGFGLVSLEIEKGRIVRISASRSYNASSVASGYGQPAVPAVLPMSKRRRRP